MLRLATDTTLERLQDYALRTATMAPNTDPLDVMLERENAAERLRKYLAHVAEYQATDPVHDVAMLHYAARNPDPTYYAGRRVS